MKSLFAVPFISLAFGVSAYGTACVTATLPTYQNTGLPFSCIETSGVTIAFNNNLLPNYAGLSVFSPNAAAPSNITVTPGSASLNFTSPNFSVSASALVAATSNQAELVHFTAFSAAGTTFGSTTFELSNASTSAGLGIATAVGQELVCVGGSFTSLPIGLVTSAVSGVLTGGNTYGCNGVTLVGTAGVSSGLASSVTSLLGFSLTGLTDSAAIQLGAYNATQIDVIKIMALSATSALTSASSASAGFGDSFALNAGATPEPSTDAMLLGGLLLTVLAANRRGKGTNQQLEKR